ncbi:unnamed protein product, partial [Clonostachys rosea]
MENENYTVAWICALATEGAAAREFFDTRHPSPRSQAPNDNNSYFLGKMGAHHVVIAVLPSDSYGTSSAAGVAKDLLRSFTSIRVALMVGIGGGAPSPTHDIRLGDIVVSTAANGHGGVVPYDFGKDVQDQDFMSTGHLNRPAVVVQTAVNAMRIEHASDGNGINEMVDAVLKQNARLRKSHGRPDPSSDRLYHPEYTHGSDGRCCAEADNEDVSKVVIRPRREDHDDDPEIHYGLIASADRLMKNAAHRDILANQHDIICFEMEAAGLMNHFPFLVVRGICDYSDTHKNKQWQGYAAMTAAAYAKSLLCRILPSRVEAEKKLSEIILETVTQTEHKVDELRVVADKKERDDILDWLTSIDYGPQHSDIIRRHQPGTGQWFLNSDKYESWFWGRKKTLYCPGMPGAGKTMMASMVVDSLLKDSRSDPSMGIAFIFCNYRHTAEQSCEKLLCSVLKQLAAPLPSVPVQLRSLKENHSSRATRPSIQELLGLLQVILDNYSITYLVIDALDEFQSSDDSRARFLNGLSNIQQHSELSILLTSRPTLDIRNHFRKATKLEIFAANDDILKYIKSRMPDLPSFIRTDLSLREEVITGIAGAVRGMFLLAQLHLDALKDTTSVRDVRNLIKHMSERKTDAYDSAYEDAMRRIEGQKPNTMKLAMRVLMWLTRAKRHLRDDELRHALSVELGSSSFNEENLVECDIISICAGMVVMDPVSRIVRLVHYTAQDFFERTWRPRFESDQKIITDICITYLSYEDFKRLILCNKAMCENLMRKFYRFHNYAASYWRHHAAHLSDESLGSVLHFLSIAKLQKQDAVWQ